MTESTACSDPTNPADQTPKRWPKHAVWIGLVIAFGNLLLYFLVFVPASPELRDSAIVNLPICWIALALALVGTVYVFKNKQAGTGLAGRVLASVGLALTLFFGPSHPL